MSKKDSEKKTTVTPDSNNVDHNTNGVDSLLVKPLEKKDIKDEKETYIINKSFSRGDVGHYNHPKYLGTEIQLTEAEYKKVKLFVSKKKGV